MVVKAVNLVFNFITYLGSSESDSAFILNDRNLEIYNLIIIFLKIYVHLRGELIIIYMLLVFS